ncbi:MAG: DUF4886 domain-containing protein [Defluviitaleaceae bacterium]|nr:DUF4886 domain-containing protein [Defluviitaleaceae bacterium]
MKILAIGNSFSSDATRYLHEISIAGGVPIKVVNLYIGGCSLATHYKNMNNDDKAYMLEFNGYETGFYASIREALQSDTWDYVTMQQASHFSPNYDTYTPYLQALSDYVKLHAPKAKQVFHRTWGYEMGSHRLCEELGYDSHGAMFGDIKTASDRAIKEVGIAAVIPSGELIEKMVSAGIVPIYRDTFHLSYGLGRYAAGALWYRFFTGNSITDNDFCKFDEEIDAGALSDVKQLVDSLDF